jgi:hypothetical protein
MEGVIFNLPASYLRKTLGRSTLPEESTEKTEQMFLSLFNVDGSDLDESKRMDAQACSKAQNSKSYQEASFKIKHNFMCALRIKRGRAGQLVLALAIQYFQREVVIEFGKKFIDLFDADLEKVSRLYGDRIIMENIDMRLVKDTYDEFWFVIKEDNYWNLAEPTNQRTGNSIVFSGRLWRLLMNCLQTRVKPLLPDMTHLCSCFNGILRELKVRARAVIKAKCVACQRPDYGGQFSCARTTGTKINQILCEIKSDKIIATSGTIFNEMWAKVDKMIPDIVSELQEEMEVEEFLLMKYHASLPGYLRDYVIPDDGIMPSDVESLFEDM